MTSLGWKDDAACAGDHGDYWFGAATPETMLACGRCPVIEDCLLEALERDWRVDAGFWGGTDEYQRRAIRKGTVTADQARSENWKAVGRVRP